MTPIEELTMTPTERADDCCRTEADPPGPAAPPDTSRHLSVAASTGALVAAFLASACCIGPLVFALLGLGGAGLLVALEPYRPYLIALTFGLLGLGFYLTYRKPKAVAVGAGGEACACPAPRTHRVGRIMLWVTTALVIVFLLFPYIAPLIWG